jgi:glucokinase
MVTQIMTCDIGGTRTRAALYDLSGKIPVRGEVIEVANQNYDNLPQVLHYCQDRLEPGSGLAAICLAVAGPVSDNQAKLTNSPWYVNSIDVSTELGIEHVYLINDFIAQGHAVSALTTADLQLLQKGRAQRYGIAAVIGAGTGLGQALIKRSDDICEVFASEGGHVDFSPRDARQIELLRYMLEKHGQVSVENLLSGSGLCHLYGFLCDTGFASESPRLASLMTQNDPAAVITRYAHADELCRETIRLFCRIYGAHAANVALSYLATGGIYLTGGVTQHILEFLGDGELLAAFRRHACMADLLHDIPLQVVRYDYPGLLGAAMYTAGRLTA